MNKPKLLDLFSGAGGAARGYQLAGFHVTGIDIKHQPRYAGDVFIQADALAYVAQHGHEYDAIHASPPCQAYSVTKSLTTKEHPKLVEQTRELLKATGKPYIIENVPGAPLINAITLCGTMFGLGVIRHRLFETNPQIWFAPAACKHDGLSTGNHKAFRKKGFTRVPRFSDGYKFISVTGNSFILEDAEQAMAIDWMNRQEIAEAIPPAYTQWIGERLMEQL